VTFYGLPLKEFPTFLKVLVEMHSFTGRDLAITAVLFVVFACCGFQVFDFGALARRISKVLEERLWAPK
jgi:hypothetical protein